MPYQCSGSDDIKISFYLKRDSQLQVDLNLYARRLSLIQHLSIVKNVHLIVDNVEQLYFTQMTSTLQLLTETCRDRVFKKKYPTDHLPLSVFGTIDYAQSIEEHHSLFDLERLGYRSQSDVALMSKFKGLFTKASSDQKSVKVKDDNNPFL